MEWFLYKESFNKLSFFQTEMTIWIFPPHTPKKVVLQVTFIASNLFL